MGRISKGITGFIFIILLLSSCGLKKKFSKTEIETNSSIKESVVLRDTTITTEASSSELKVLLEDLLDGQERMVKSGNSVSRVRYNTITKEIEADCDCIEMDIVLKLIDKIIEKETTTTKTTDTKVVKTSFWDMIKYGLTGALILFVIIVAAFLIKKVI